MRSVPKLTLFTSLVAALLLSAAHPVLAGPDASEDTVAGHLSTFAAGVERGLDISGPVRLQRGEDWTQVKVNAHGLAPDTSYNAHLHHAACDDANGGGHYMDDPAGGTTPPNELWLAIGTNPAGSGKDSSSAPWAVRDGSRSVVIHDTDGARIACADLPVG